jgi:hypothetical protein
VSARCAPVLSEELARLKAPNARTSKALSSSKSTKAIRSQNVHHHQRRANLKKARVLAQLRATIAVIIRTIGWTAAHMRGVLAQVVRKKLGFRLASDKANSERVYRIVTGASSYTLAEPRV